MPLHRSLNSPSKEQLSLRRRRLKGSFKLCFRIRCRAKGKLNQLLVHFNHFEQLSCQFTIGSGISKCFK